MHAAAITPPAPGVAQREELALELSWKGEVRLRYFFALLRVMNATFVWFFRKNSRTKVAAYLHIFSQLAHAGINLRPKLAAIVKPHAHTRGRSTSYNPFARSMLPGLPEGNASPERVFAVVVRKLDRLKFEIVVFAQDAPQAPPGAAILAVADRVILLPRHEGMASVAESTHAGGGKVVSPGLPNLHRSREIIQAEQVKA